MYRRKVKVSHHFSGDSEIGLYQENREKGRVGSEVSCSLLSCRGGCANVDGWLYILIKLRQVSSALILFSRTLTALNRSTCHSRLSRIQDHYKSYRDINDLYNYNKAKVIFDRICFNASASRGVWQSADAAPILMGPEGYDRAKADGSLANRERMGLTASGYADEPAFLSILQAEMARARDPSNPNRAVNGIPAASSSRAGGVAGYGADNRSARQSSAGGTFGSYSESICRNSTVGHVLVNHRNKADRRS